GAGPRAALCRRVYGSSPISLSSAASAQHRAHDGVADAGRDRSHHRFGKGLAIALAPAGAPAHQDITPAVGVRVPRRGRLGGALLKSLIALPPAPLSLVLAVDRTSLVWPLAVGYRDRPEPCRRRPDQRSLHHRRLAATVQERHQRFADLELLDHPFDVELGV